MEYNQPRRCIRRYFPTRKCFTFPLPVPDPALLERLGELTADKMVMVPAEVEGILRLRVRQRRDEGCGRDTHEWSE